MSSKDYYSILGVDRNASKDEIQKAYRKAALKYHPDRQQGKSDAEKKEAEEKFKECSEAASVLTDDEKRASYDRFGSAGPQEFGGNGFDPFEYFRQMHGFDDNIFDGFNFGNFGFGNRQDRGRPHGPNDPIDGEDVAIRITTDMAFAVYGGVSDFSVDFDDPCPKCGGTGAKDGQLKACRTCGGTGMETIRHGLMMTSFTCRTCHGRGTEPGEPCPDCQGKGVVHSIRQVKIAIPPGTRSGYRFRIAGEGGKGRNGGTPGDLIVEVNVMESSVFGRNGTSLVTLLPISPITSAIGGTVKVETPWGTEMLEIPPGTMNGTEFKIKGHGIRIGDMHGDLVVKIVISTLVGLSDEQKKTLRDLEKALSDKNVATLEDTNRSKREFRKGNLK